LNGKPSHATVPLSLRGWHKCDFNGEFVLTLDLRCLPNSQELKKNFKLDQSTFIKKKRLSHACYQPQDICTIEGISAVFLTKNKCSDDYFLSHHEMYFLKFFIVNNEKASQLLVLFFLLKVFMLLKAETRSMVLGYPPFPSSC
jgi:hypothetical protein